MLLFVVGCGRSGTHWLAHSVAARDDVYATIEDPEIFGLATRLALNPVRRVRGIPRLVSMYRNQIRLNPKPHYLDKSHPVMWYAEELAERMEGATFLGIARGPRATVASMLAHPRVVGWHKRWRTYPLPNAFLGITERDVCGYDKYSRARRCALRWLSHVRRLAELKTSMPDRVVVLSYERLHARPLGTLLELDERLGWSPATPEPRVRVEPMTKWKKGLSAKQLADVESVAEQAGDYAEICDLEG